MEQEKCCCRLQTFGRVQGVYYRLSTQRQAAKLELTGWAHNLADGSVEVLACGKESALNLLVQWCHQGAIAARVDKVLCESKPWQEIQGFEIG